MQNKWLVNVAACAVLSGSLVPVSGAAQTAAGKDAVPAPADPAKTSGVTTDTAANAAPPTPAPVDTQGGLDEIVVTAERRSANLQIVPVSVSAVAASSLQAAGVNTTQALASLVPGLTFNNNLSGGIPFIRGVGQTTGILGPENPVAMYIDGVYLAAPQSSSFSFNNIEQVEVLKGPQGTLFGRNTTGGVIQIITKTPSATPSMDATIGYGRFDTLTGQFYGTTGVSGNLSTNLALYGQNRANGLVRNVTINKDVYTRKTLGAQNKWLLDLGRTTVGLNLMYSYDKSYEGNTFTVFPGSIADNKVSTYLGWRKVALSLDTPITNKQYLSALTVKSDFDAARFTSISAFHRLNSFYSFTQNAIPNGPPGVAVNQLVTQKDDTFTQEFQLQAPAGNDFQWIVGAFYLRDIAFLRYDVRPNAATAPTLLGNATQHTDSLSGFAQATKTILPDTRLTLGIRYSNDRKSISGTVVTAAGTATPSNPNGLGTLPPLKNPTSWGNFTYRASLDHSFTDDIFGYISYNRGFKSGVYNLSSFTNPPVDPETVNAYEAGLKTEFFDRHLRANFSVFQNNVKNAQLRRVGLTPGSILLSNAGSARARGVDFDIQAVPVRGLTLRVGGTFLDAIYTSLKNAPYAAPNPVTFATIPAKCVKPATLPAAAATPGGNTTLICDLTGNRAVRSPKFSGTFGIDYKTTFDSGWKLAMSANDAYNSGFAWDPDNRLRQKSFHNVSASVKFSAPGDRYDVSFWGANLANELMFNTATAGSTDTASAGMPLTYGVTFGLHL